MTFALKMAWRDSRASRRRLALFSLSIVLGVAALVAIGSFRDNLRQAVAEQSKTLLGADLAVTSRQKLPAEASAFLDHLGGEQAREIAFSSMIVFPTRGGQTRIAQVRALEGSFPFYGEAVTVPAEALKKLDAGDAAVLEDSLMAQFGLRIGDPIRVGEATFSVAAALQKIPGESPAVAMLAPRVYIPLRALERTHLVQTGSLVRYRTYFKFAPGYDVEALVRDLRERFRILQLGFDTVENRKRDLGRALDNVESFLNLVGFIALFLGAIGVASAMQVYVQQKVATVAVLRCLGATARRSFAVYLWQGLGLGLLGAGLGALLGLAAQLVLPAMFRTFLPVDARVFISWRAVASGMGAGLVVCLLFTLLPLLSIRRVSPLRALRTGFGEPAPGRDPLRWALSGLIGVAGLGCAWWQTNRWQRGLGFALALAATFGVLTGVARLLTWAARRWVPRRLPYVWRQGLANLYRPNNRTVLLLVALGLGTFLVLTLYLTRASLLGEFAGSTGDDRPNLLFFDVQDDQLAGVDALLQAGGAPVRQEAPIVTMRISTLKGRPVEEWLRDRGPGRGGWALRREYRCTYRGRLADTEKVVAGSFVGRVIPGAEVVPISVEEGLAKELQVQIGDEITFDVQGVPIRTRVGSLRSVEWQRLQANFFVVFPEGVLEAAPKFFVVATRVRSPAHSAAMQQAVVRAYPNVSAIDLGLVLQTLDGIFSKVALVVRFMAMFVALTGVIVMAGAVLTGRFQRVQENVLLRTLGATRRQVQRIMFAEYSVLGLLAAVTGSLLAVGANWLLVHFVFETRFAPSPLLLLAAVVAVTTVTVVTGLLASRGDCDHPPLAVLRQEI
ncbi:MAG TPA: FtsX-like permease family protein [Opitutaceae bacterium]|nr:FtsX-like permease family protein [Opitutaceae bacterium]